MANSFNLQFRYYYYPDTSSATRNLSLSLSLCVCVCVCVTVCVVMAVEAYASQNPNTVHADVLSKARQSCYKARDAFYACLEKESNKKPTEIASVGLLYPVECKKPRDQYVKQCRPTWVKHFDRQYCAKKRVQRLLDDNEGRRGV
ncbi:uncharacterized protein LOC132279754 isoform X2 [Cornus florida]|uniref:uncharacterized protein LOC132279754 isoform X2 n=1 Tax=Cornus florida TaxID=4283 RepID=UPI002896E41C|nr:uncharacterized protein LOC132279754 isoform X2 [Cornus florida]